MGNALYKTNQDIPDDMLLGNLLFTNLIDMKIAVSDLTAIFKHNNIPEKYVKNISGADAFRRASSSIKNRTMYINNPLGGNDKVRVEVDEIKSDVDGIKRIIGVKRVDDVHEDISYEPIGEIVFNRSTNSCMATPLFAPGDADYNEVKTLCDEVTNKFIDWSSYHTKDTVRNIINRIIIDTHPINLMPTGLCKFIPQPYTDLLYNLKGALTDLTAYREPNTTGENIIELIPVIDTHEQRHLVEKNFTSEITNELFSFTQELKEVLKQKNRLSIRTASSYIDKFKELESKAKDYENLLGVYTHSLHVQITEALELVDCNTDDNKESKDV